MSAHLPVAIDFARLAEALARFPRDPMTWIDWTSLGATASRTTLRKRGSTPQWLRARAGCSCLRARNSQESGAAARPLETAPDRIRRESDELEG